MKIKICFVATTPGTLKAFVFKFAKYLYDSGHFDISFVCDYNPDFASTLPNYISYFPIKMKRGMSLNGVSAIRKMITLFRKQRFDIVQYSTPNAAFYASIASKRAHIPTRLYTQWGIRYMGFNNGLKRNIFKYIEKAICKNSTSIECESNSLYNFAISEKLFSKEKACVVGRGSACGVDLNKFSIENKADWRSVIRKQYSISDNSIVFGYVGRITRDKGINELFKAFKKLLSYCNNVYLLIVGNYDYAETIDPNLLNWATSNDNIIFVGHTNNQEWYYSAMDVFVSLSYREGFGLVVIEAASMGIPAIVSDAVGQIDTIVDGEDGFLVKTKDAESTYMKMKWIIDNKDLLNSFGNSAYTKVVSFYEEGQLFGELEKKRYEYFNKK